VEEQFIHGTDTNTSVEKGQSSCVMVSQTAGCLFHRRITTTALSGHDVVIAGHSGILQNGNKILVVRFVLVETIKTFTENQE